MRINVYSQELTNEVQLETKKSNTGETYSAVRLILHSSLMLHHPPADDDRSAVTFWLPKSAKRRKEFAATLERMANIVLGAESGHECTGCTMQTDHNGQCVCRGCDQPYGPRR